MYKVPLVAQPNLEDVGFKVDMQLMDWAPLLQKRNDRPIGTFSSHPAR
jgi:hypothetical protein